jgi:multidrug efflux pump subunit AcrA (membrane-fusion protein)
VARRTIDLAAPASGVVTEKMVVRGQRVEAGMPLVTLVDLSSIWVEADLYEADAALARVGQSALLQLTYDPAFRVESRISFLYPELEPETRTLRARFDVANRDELLKPGMLVDVELELGELAGVAVPTRRCRDRSGRWSSSPGRRRFPPAVDAGRQAGRRPAGLPRRGRRPGGLFKTLRAARRCRPGPLGAPKGTIPRGHRTNGSSVSAGNRPLVIALAAVAAVARCRSSSARGSTRCPISPTCR